MSYIYCKKGHILEHISGKNYYCSICDEKTTLTPQPKRDWYTAVAEMTQKEFSTRYNAVIRKWNEENREFLEKLR